MTCSERKRPIRRAFPSPTPWDYALGGPWAIHGLTSRKRVICFDKVRVPGGYKAYYSAKVGEEGGEAMREWVRVVAGSPRGLEESCPARVQVASEIWSQASDPGRISYRQSCHLSYKDIPLASGAERPTGCLLTTGALLLHCPPECIRNGWASIHPSTHPSTCPSPPISSPRHAGYGKWRFFSRRRHSKLCFSVRPHT